MSDFQNYLHRQLEDPEFKKEYEASQGEYEIMHALIEARLQSGMTQQELAEHSGIRQSNISRIENGNCIPTLTTLQALAAAMGKKLSIRFVEA